ncbi:substrate-binding periplasmic protein [Kordiimonas lacus]|uniref:Polar amino acid transport system substrate-binding protein n=1 Tax=Kordiimonas lacus TaxID=637679 RepID=A0A1G7BHQ7_9PROT|nr:transporter substrate-binding domain-containing protein [Kordiimonas lacus]SDE26638.1 polar amino acid transport system substrate-binding protein [Kordiimonas lacus]
MRSSRLWCILGLTTLVSASVMAADLRLITEENAPVNYRDPESGEIAGAAHLLVEEMLRRADVSATFELLPWQRGFRDASTTPNVCLYGMNRTPERETMFEWVGPLFHSGWGFFGYDQTIALSNLDDLGGHTVVSKVGDAVTIALMRDRPETRNITVEDDVAAIRLMRHGRGDLWLTGIVNARSNAELAGLPMPDMKLMWKRSVIYLGCGRGTKPEVLARMRAILPGLTDYRDRLAAEHWGDWTLEGKP